MVIKTYLGSLSFIFILCIAHAQPGPRWGHSLIYFPNEDQLILFGGAKERGSFLDDMWIHKEGDWIKQEIDGPSARGFSAIAYHAQRGSVILHGGRGNDRVTYSDLWEWDGSKWEQLSSEGPYMSDHHQMVYVESANKLLAYGGWTGEKVVGETWTWDGKWTKVSDETPPKRSAFGMVYNPKTDKVQLYGGLWISGQYADVWEWSNNKWESVGGPYDRSSLDHHIMIYDHNLEQTIIFGGKNYRYKMRGETLALEDSEIILLSAEGPSPRHSTGFTYDKKRDVAYLYGGKVYQGDQQVGLADFWLWDGKKWSILE